VKGGLKLQNLVLNLSDQLEKMSHIEELFKKISKERGSGDR